MRRYVVKSHRHNRKLDKWQYDAHVIEQCQSLWAAVILRAVLDAQTKSTQQVPALKWLFSDRAIPVFRLADVDLEGLRAKLLSHPRYRALQKAWAELTSTTLEAAAATIEVADKRPYPTVDDAQKWMPYQDAVRYLRTCNRKMSLLIKFYNIPTYRSYNYVYVLREGVYNLPLTLPSMTTLQKALQSRK